MRRNLRARRGVEAIEFAMILPLFFAILFATVEFSWYMFQRAGVTDAARVACRAAAQLDPRFDDVEGVAALVAYQELRMSLVDCDGGDIACLVVIEDELVGATPNVTCDIVVDFKPITGFLGGTGGAPGGIAGLSVGDFRFGSAGLMPRRIRGNAIAVYEGLP